MGLRFSFCGMPLLNYIEFAGIHTDPSLRCVGNRIPKLDVRSADRTSQTSVLSGCRKLQPSFPPPLRKDLVHPAAHSKQFKRGMPQSLR